VEVQLRARGTGCTLYNKEVCKAQAMLAVDFGTEYTYKQVPRQYFLENRGRKPMKIIWVRQNKVDRKKKQGEIQQKASDSTALMKRTGSILGENAKEEEQFVFSVVPE